MRYENQKARVEKMANYVKTYYDVLRAEGFEKTEAIKLTEQLHQKMLDIEFRVGVQYER